MRLLILFISVCCYMVGFAQVGLLINFDDTIPSSISIPSQSLWEIGEPSKNTFDSAYSAPRAIMTDTINPYPVNSNTYFDLVVRSPFPGSGFFEPVIVNFRHRFNTDSLKDAATISYTYDGAQTWFSIQQNTDFFSSTATGQGGSYDPAKGFSGNSGGWHYSQVVFYEFCDGTQQVDSLVLRFRFSSDSIFDNKDGWMIDDLNWSFAICPGVKTLQPDPFVIAASEETLVITSTVQNNPSWSFKIYDSNGRLLNSCSEVLSPSASFDISAYSKGLYFFTIIKPTGEMIVKRFVK